MNMKSTLPIACFAGTLLLAGGLSAAPADNKTPQSPPAAHHDIPADLARQAKISLAAARTTALAKVPHGKVRSEELEKENGKLIYSFDIEVPGKAGVEEVAVSAISGKVLDMHHETPRQERREAEKEGQEHHPPRE
jgi:hypothetical protein